MAGASVLLFFSLGKVSEGKKVGKEEERETVRKVLALHCKQILSGERRFAQLFSPTFLNVSTCPQGASLVAQTVESAYNAGDAGSIPGSRRYLGEGNSYAFHMPPFPGGIDGKDSTCNAGDLASILGSGRPPGEGNGNPL